MCSSCTSAKQCPFFCTAVNERFLDPSPKYLKLSTRIDNHVAAFGLCCSVYVCLNALASPNPLILPPVSGKELHRDTERAMAELRVHVQILIVLLQGCWKVSESGTNIVLTQLDSNTRWRNIVTSAHGHCNWFFGRPYTL